MDRTIGYPRWLARVERVVDGLVTPSGPGQMVVDLIFLNALAALVYFFDLLYAPAAVRAAYALAITIISLSFLGGAWYYLRLWTRWARIRRHRTRAGA